MSTLNVLYSDPSITYLPAGAWNTTTYEGGLAYAYGDVQILYTFSEPATGLSWYGSMSGSGGTAEVCFDCSVNSTSGFLVNYTDASAGAYVPAPGVIEAFIDLSFDIHNVTITNVYDAQANNGAGGYGWLYFQGFQLTGTDGSSGTGSNSVTSGASAPTSATSQAPATVTVTDFVTTVKTVTAVETVTATVRSSATSATPTSSALKIGVRQALAYGAAIALIAAGCTSMFC